VGRGENEGRTGKPGLSDALVSARAGRAGSGQQQLTASATKDFHFLAKGIMKNLCYRVSYI
jgi:hypothetical protein